jgi:CDP-diacylglycerol--serine O-phosphatidyltransferase
MKKRLALPSLFTISNLCCGFLSIFYTMEGRYLPAAWLIVIGAFLDAFDGKIARLLDAPSEFGNQFDSIADVCSFGVAPAVLMLSYFQDLMVVRWLPFAITCFFLLCGATRLARFNTQLKGFEKADFCGLPIPAAACSLAAFIVFTQRVWTSTHEPQVAVSLCVMLALLMVSNFEYPAFPKVTLETNRDRFRLGMAMVAIVPLVFYTDESFLPLTLAFALSGPARWLKHQVLGREVADITN